MMLNMFRGGRGGRYVRIFTIMADLVVLEPNLAPANPPQSIFYLDT